MRRAVFALLLVSLITSLAAAPRRQGQDDGDLRAAIDRFFAMQAAENVEGYLALWSATAKKPTPEQLKYVFDSGDDTYSDITIVRTYPDGDRVRVRVNATRDRVFPSKIPGGQPFKSHATTSWSLSYVREGGAWKLVREGTAADGLAEVLAEAHTADEREQSLALEPDLLSDNLVMALSRRAGEAAQRRAYPEAQAGFELARDIAHRIGSQRLEGEALQNLAFAMYYQRNFDGALRVYEERLALERSRADEDGIGAALLGIATIRYSAAEYGPALAAYREALALEERRNDESAIAATLISTGNVLYIQGDFAGAIADYTRSRELSRKVLNTEREAEALEGLGRVLVAQGNYAAALEAFAGVLAEAKAAKSDNKQGTALLSIGDIHLRLGNVDSARASLNEGRTHFEAIKDLGKVGRAWHALGLTEMVAGRFDLAEANYRKSIASCTSVGDQECIPAATVALAFAQTKQDKFADGIASYKQAIAGFTSLRAREQAARAEIGLSQALTLSGAYAPAIDAAGRARLAAEALANDDVLWRARVTEASALRHLRERAKSMEAALAAVTAADRLLAAANIRPGLAVARDASSALAMLALLQAEAGDAPAAFESAERMRAYDLRLLLLRGERDISRGMTDAERDEERAMAVEVVSLVAQLSRERDLPKPDPQRIARLDKSLTEATARRELQQQRLFERLPALRVWRGLVAPATRSDLSELLPGPDVAIVEFIVLDEAVLTLVARRRAEAVELATYFEPVSRGKLSERVARLLQQGTLRDRSAWTKAANELLPGTAAVFGSVTRAIVIPHDVLWRVPFEALPVESRYLADSLSIVYAPSVTALVRTPAPAQSGEGPARATELLLAVAPALEPSMVDRLAQTAPDWSLRTQPDPDKLAQLVHGDPDHTRIMSRADATEAALRERLPSADLIHLATPFRINGASPLFSPLLLAPDTANDGALEAREVMNLDLHARLAILSDGGAMSLRDAADEAAAVAWAWRAAGVPAIIMPRWTSEDQSADDLLAELHARLRAGDAPDVALRAACAKLRAKPGAAPLSWAAWMLIVER